METNVEAKKVVVQADESVSPQLMLEKLQKVGACAASVLRVVDGEWNAYSHQRAVLYISSQFTFLIQWSASSGKSVELAA